MMQEGQAPADWSADPMGRHQYRYWDGASWTGHVADGGEASEDPLGGVAADSSAGAPAEPDMTIESLVREFMVDHESDLTLMDIDWIRRIVNEGCSAEVLRVAHIHSGKTVHLFMKELAGHHFIERVPWQTA